MGKVLPFKKRQEEQRVAERLVNLGSDIDGILLGALEEGLNPREVAGILSHRLGSLMAHLKDKEELWPICEKVLKRQAKIDSE